MDQIQLGAEEPVRLDVVDGVARLVLQRPAVLNAVSEDLLDALLAALDSPVLDRAGALVLTGAGSGFCAGADLMALRAAMDTDLDAVLGPMVAALHTIVLRLRALPMPVVAAVEGVAVGGGMGLALAADLRVVGRSAMFVPGNLALGASPDGGVSYFLARALGGARATSTLVLNEPLDAPTPRRTIVVRTAPSGTERSRATAASVADSTRTMAPIERRWTPTARSSPISLVRSRTDMARVLASPSRPIRTATPRIE